MISFQADDKDSGKLGKVRYTLTGNATDHFAIDSSSGIVRTKKSFENPQLTRSPFIFTITARDNPNSSDYNQVEAPLVVNLISSVNRMVLEIGDAKPDVVANKIDVVTSVIQEQSGLVVGIEKLNVREFVGENGTLESDPAGTDVWFYVVDPESDTILPLNHTIVQR